MERTTLVAGSCTEQRYMATFSHILKQFEEATENSTTACSNLTKCSRKCSIKSGLAVLGPVKNREKIYNKTKAGR
jgi:hypothetical protein